MIKTESIPAGGRHPASIAGLIAIASRDIAGKGLAIFFPIIVFVTSGFKHVVANMFCLSESEKRGLKGYTNACRVGYISPVFSRMTMIIFPLFSLLLATLKAAWTAAPEEMPVKGSSSPASRAAKAKASPFSV